MASDDLDIRSGGIVAVDTETLRAAAARLVAEGVACEELRASLDRARAARDEEFAGGPAAGDEAIEAHVRWLLERRASGQ